MTKQPQQIKQEDRKDVPEKEDQTQPAVTNISEAVCAVMADLQRLKKADHNKFANYDFTSVDDFKDAVRPLMAQYGLYHHTTQDVFALETVTDGKGKTHTFARFDFLITLKHVCGDVEPAELITVMLPFTGAQTSGAARSYALKECLMKGRFMASAGDQQEEADLLDNSREGLRLSKTDARKLYVDLTTELRDKAKGADHEIVATWWKDSKERLDTLPKDWFLTLKNEYGETWKNLKAQADLDKMSNEELDRLANEQEQERQRVEDEEIAQHPLNGG